MASRAASEIRKAKASVVAMNLSLDDPGTTTAPDPDFNTAAAVLERAAAMISESAVQYPPISVLYEEKGQTRSPAWIDGAVTWTKDHAAALAQIPSVDALDPKNHSFHDLSPQPQSRLRWSREELVLSLCETQATLAFGRSDHKSYVLWFHRAVLLSTARTQAPLYQYAPAMYWVSDVAVNARTLAIGTGPNDASPEAVRRLIQRLAIDHRSRMLRHFAARVAEAEVPDTMALGPNWPVLPLQWRDHAQYVQGLAACVAAVQQRNVRDWAVVYTESNGFDLDAAAVALASALYRHEHGGAWPHDIKSLVPRYLPRAPKSLFGDPFAIRRFDNGPGTAPRVVLYSRGLLDEDAPCPVDSELPVIDVLDSRGGIRNQLYFVVDLAAP
jgi:hypothetical protein